MKQTITTLLLIFSLTIFAQSNKVTGDYNRILTIEGGDLFDYKLTLHQDGTFLFHYYSKIKHGTPPEVNSYGKGKWSIKDNLITFSNQKEDFDKKYTLVLNNSKARFITKNPRDKTDQIVQTNLVFLESEIFWLKNIVVFKI